MESGQSDRKPRVKETVKQRTMREMREMDLPLEPQSIRDLIKKVEDKGATYPESKARAKTERKEAYQFIADLLRTIEVYESNQHNSLMAPYVRKTIVRDIKRRLKLE